MQNQGQKKELFFEAKHDSREFGLGVRGQSVPIFNQEKGSLLDFIRGHFSNSSTEHVPFIHSFQLFLKNPVKEVAKSAKFVI